MDYVRQANNIIAVEPCRPTYMYILDFRHTLDRKIRTVMERGDGLRNIETSVGCQKAQHGAHLKNFQLLSLRKALLL
jgi:hypothetical protein